MSNQVIQGRIDAIRTKQVNTKFGDKAVYIAVINGQEVNLGFKHPFAEGETVSIEAEHKYGSLQYVGPAQPGAVATPPQAVPQTATKQASSGAFPVAPNANGTSICRQSALNRAVETMDQLVRAGLCPALSSKEAYVAYIIELAYIYTDFSTGQREVKAARVQQAEPSEAAPVQQVA